MSNKIINFDNIVALREFLNKKLDDNPYIYLKCLEYLGEGDLGLPLLNKNLLDIQLIWGNDQFYVDGYIEESQELMETTETKEPIEENLTHFIVPFNQFLWGYEIRESEYSGTSEDSENSIKIIFDPNEGSFTGECPFTDNDLTNLDIREESYDNYNRVFKYVKIGDLYGKPDIYGKTFPDPKYLKKDGYVFSGWYLEQLSPNSLNNSDNSAIKISNTSYVEKKENHTLYAYWVSDWVSDEYKITFDLNDWPGTTAAKVENINFTLEKERNTEQKQSTQYSIMYKPGDINSKIANATRPGYVNNARWTVLSTDGDWSSNVTYRANRWSGIGSYGNVTLKAANWVPQTYNIIYYANNGTENTEKQDSVSFDSNVTLYTNGTDTDANMNWTQDGYVFDCWNAQADGSGAYNFEAGATVINGTGLQQFNGSNAIDVELYAIWKAQNYTLTVNNGNGANIKIDYSTLNTSSHPYTTSFIQDSNISSSSTAAYRVQYGTAVTLDATMNTGYDFLAWTTDNATFTDEEAASTGIEEMPMAATSVTATYRLKAYQISFNLNGGSWDSTNLPTYYKDRDANDESLPSSTQTTFGIRTTSVNALYGTVITLNPPKKNGYTFSSWTKTSGAGTLNGNLFTVGDGAATLTAVFEATQYNVVFMQNPDETVYNTNSEIGYVGSGTKAAFLADIFKTVTLTPVSDTETEVTTPNPFAGDDGYIYTTKANETRFIAKWKFATGENTWETVENNDILGLDTIQAYAVRNSGTSTFELRVYPVWSANYYGLEHATQNFQNAYLHFAGSAAAERGLYYLAKPQYGRLPAVNSTADAWYLYDENVTTNSAYEIYTRASGGTVDSRDNNVYLPAGHYAWAAKEIASSSDEVDTRNANIDDFDDSIIAVNRAYYDCTLPLQVMENHTAASGLYTQSQQATLDQYAARLNASVTTPGSGNSFLQNLKLADIDVNAAYSISDILTTAQSIEGDLTNQCGSGSTVTIEQQYETLLNNTFHETIDGYYPATEEDETHSYADLKADIEAVLAPYMRNGSYDFTQDAAGSIYTKESVSALYTVYVSMTRQLYGNGTTLMLKMPSVFRYKYVIVKLAMAYHSLELDQAVFDTFDGLWYNYVMATWGAAGNGRQVFNLDPSKIDGLKTYFTEGSVQTLTNFVAAHEGNPNHWTAVVQNAVDGKVTSVTRRSTQTDADGNPYYNETFTADYNFANGTLCDQLLDLVDALVPRPAEYTDVYNLLNTIPYHTAVSPYPGTIQGESAAATKALWEATYKNSTAFDTTATNAHTPYDMHWLTRYYTQDSVNALATLLNSTIKWNLTTINQPLINGMVTGGSYTQLLTAAIAGLTPREFRVTLYANRKDGQAEEMYTITVHMVNEEAVPFYYGDTLTTGASFSYTGWSLMGYSTDRNAAAPDSAFELAVNSNALSFELNDANTALFTTRDNRIYTLNLYSVWDRHNNTQVDE